MADFYKNLFTKSRERYIKVLQQQARQAQKRAKYLASPKGLAIETFKGLPGAVKTIGKKIFPLPYSTLWLKEKEKQYKESKKK